ncbi:hypothetical protein J7F02_10750 [Streptomyces sp. ISL-112]|uniref:hypothetical protein n=1 Tax=unclassified Streptomyces TaxID=2593676 RepID=UPI001BEA7704|nr:MULTISPECIES: hypothetical protein [unclassified Streptomyces]MBT2426143.1 hypothetical protein [Streptomyces sp. ISL-112]MBT2461318.1 hypothetical protein [Streptomyces sp. ISL-63]
MSYRLGDPVQSAIRCPKPDCRRLLINGQGCDCAWRAEPDPDPLVGRLVAFTDPDTGRVMAAGKVTNVDRADGGMTLTVVQYETPDMPRSDGDPATLPPGMNWRDHL